MVVLLADLQRSIFVHVYKIVIAYLWVRCNLQNSTKSHKNWGVTIITVSFLARRFHKHFNISLILLFTTHTGSTEDARYRKRSYSETISLSFIASTPGIFSGIVYVWQLSTTWILQHRYSVVTVTWGLGMQLDSLFENGLNIMVYIITTIPNKCENITRQTV